MGNKTVEAKYSVDDESFAFAEYWLSGEYASDRGLGHSELLHHKWELAQQVQDCVESYFRHELNDG